MTSSKIELLTAADGSAARQATTDNDANSVYFILDRSNMKARSPMNFALNNLPRVAERFSSKNAITFRSTLSCTIMTSVAEPVVNKRQWYTS